MAVECTLDFFVDKSYTHMHSLSHCIPTSSSCGTAATDMIDADSKDPDGKEEVEMQTGMKCLIYLYDWLVRDSLVLL